MSILRIATCRPLPEPDADEDLLLAACRAAGIDAHMVAWHDTAAWQSDRPSHGAPVLLRSTWDYIHRLAEFESWLQTVSETASVWNPWTIVRSNLRKDYLLKLSAKGVATTPTLLVPKGSKNSLRALTALQDWSDVVIKPVIGVASFSTFRLQPSDPAAEACWSECVAARDMLIQPYLKAVEDEGERALVWIDGCFTHAVRKTPRFAHDVEQVSQALPISDAQRALGTAALAAALPDELARQLLYARVDVARDAAGEWRIMELELIEPSLFLKQHPPALHRLVAALTQRMS